MRPALRAVAIAVCAAVAFLGLGDARAQEAPAEALGGYQGSGASSGLHAYYLPEGALPITTFIDLGAPDALATIASGPTTFARASAADPGDLLASPETLLTNASKDYPAGTIPNYPYRVSATSGFGAPNAESEPAPGLRAAVEVKEGSSTTRATMPRAAAPAVATFGSMSANATTSTDGSTVTVKVKTSMSDFNLLGILMIDSVVTDLTATSDGTATTLTGGTVVSGASVLGTPVTIDSKGIHGSPSGTPDPTGGLFGGIGSAVNPLAEVLAGTDGFDEVLSQAGIRVTVAKPAKQEAGTEGVLSSYGLRVDFELSDDTAPILGTLTDALPPFEPLVPGAPGVEDIVAFARARHLTRLEIARGEVSLSATPGFTFEEPPFTADGGTGSAGVTPIGDLPVAAPSSGSASPTAPSSPLATSPTAAAPEVPLGVGIGALAALVLLVQPFLGARLARFSTAILGAGDTASCPLGGTTMTTATAMERTDTPAGLSAEDREARLTEGADELAKGRRSLVANPNLLLWVSACLMTTGLSIILLGWFGAARATIVEEQVPYLISGGLLGVAISVIGALTLFAHWLTVLVRENRRQEIIRKQEHIELMEALALLTAALDGKEASNGKLPGQVPGRARGAQPERAVRRAPRRQ